MTTYIEVHDATDVAVQSISLGGVEPVPRVGFSYYPVLGPIIASVDWRSRPSPSCVLKWNAGAWAWQDPKTLAEHQAQAIANVDAFADAARLAVVGDPARIKEYEDAQQAAEQYRDAGYTGPVPEAVQSWCDAKYRDAWTPKQACEDILAASARWHSALRYIRRARLDAKEGIKAATAGDACNSIVSTFRNSVTTTMQGVQ